MKLTIFTKQTIFDALQCFEYVCEIGLSFHFPVIAGLCIRLATVWKMNQIWASNISNSVAFKDKHAFVQD